MKKQLVKVASKALSAAARSFSERAKVFAGSLPVPKDLRK